MPKLTTIQNSFVAGEISPRLYGRTELPAYNSALKTAENVLLLVQGGAIGRYGLRWVASAKNASKKARLIPFVYSTTQAYALEIGDTYIRFFTAGGVLGGPLEVVSPFLEADLPNITYAQLGDTLFLQHPSYYPRRLVRLGATTWRLDNVPFLVEPSDEQGDKPAASITLSAVSGAITVTASAASFLDSDVGRQVVAGVGIATITGFTTTTVVNATVTDTFDTTVYASQSWTLTESPRTACTPSAIGPEGASITLTLAINGWRATDVGKYVALNDGLCEITGFTSTTIVDALVRTPLSTATAAQSNVWTLESKLWNATNGYPRAVGLHQQRLVYAGSAAFPVTVTASRTGEYFNFARGPLDADAYTFDLVSQDASPLQHLVSTQLLLGLSYGGEYTVSGGGINAALTPTNVAAENPSSYGAGTARPARLGSDVIYPQRSGKKLRGILQVRDDKDFSAIDMTQLADHVTGTGITEIALQPEPDPQLWCVRADGVIATLAADRPAGGSEYGVMAWSRQTTDGLVESVCSIPYNGADQVWAIVNRTIGGVTKRYVEYFDSTLHTDAAITGTSGPGAATWSGLSHLEAKTVDVVADGVVMPQATVSGGQITLPRNAFAVEIGLHFEPNIKLLPIEIQTGTGTAQGAAVSVHEIIVRLKDSIGCTVGGEQIPFRQFGVGILDTPIPAFTGDKRVSHLGWSDKGEIEIRQTQPLPIHVLAVVRRFSVNDG